MAKKYQNYTFEDFITDDDFIAWVKYPTDASSIFWENYIFEHPHQNLLMEQAKGAVQQLAIASRKNAPAGDNSLIWDKLEFNKSMRTGAGLKFRFGWKMWTAAASVFIILGATLDLDFWYKSSVTESDYVQQKFNKRELLKEISNTTQVALSIVLPDSSKITLKPNSKISYNPFFAGNLREVFLSGEAFFDVRKNPEKAFVVHSNGLVTKVLGTIFSVKAFENDEKVIVKVQTGKVTVYSAKSSKNEDPETGGLILFPNQKVEFGTTEDRFIRTLVEKPMLLKPNADINQFTFKNTPAATIFKALENAYGVELIYDKDLLSSCYLTTTLTDESLFEKLDIICAAIEAGYKEIDAQIVISSKGCK
jgi:ferric-dicitrate binding protein FerR (iron transport regulator)